MITLYDCATAPNPRRARMLLAEKGVPHRSVQVDLARGEQLGEAYRRVNPACTVPALQLEDGSVLTDNAGIAAYVEARWPDPPLMGRTPLEKGEVASWHARIEQEGLWAIGEALRNGSPAMKDRALPGPDNHEQIPALAERGLRRTQRFFELLDRRLEGRVWVAGDGFSIADILAIVSVDFARIVRLKPGPEHVNLLRWRAAMAERPSVSL